MSKQTFYQMLRYSDLEKINIFPNKSLMFPVHDCNKISDRISVNFINIFGKDSVLPRSAFFEDLGQNELLNMLNQYIYLVLYFTYEKNHLYLNLEKNSVASFEFMKMFSNEKLLFNYKRELLCIRFIKSGLPSTKNLIFMLEQFIQMKVIVEEFVPEKINIAPTVLNCMNHILGYNGILGQKITLIGNMINIILDQITFNAWLSFLKNERKIIYLNELISCIVGTNLKWHLYVKVFVENVRIHIGDKELFLGRTTFFSESSSKLHIMCLNGFT
ncbi:MAG: type VI secretion system baseplate subunit TssG [Gammaproteobacteria bacterium]